MTDYAATRAAFQLEKPERFNFARDVIDRWAGQDPDKLAIWWVDDAGREHKRSFAQIATASCKLANALTNLGIGRGDVVCVILGRQLQWWEIFTACLRMGTIVAPGTTQLTAKDLQYRINTAKAACVITDAANAPKVEAIQDQCPCLKAALIVDSERTGWTGYAAAVAAASDRFATADTGADEAAIVYFTSGTVGFPKMTVHTHASYPLGHQVTGRFWLDLTPDDLHWNISDTGWAKAAWSSYFGPWICGAAVFVHHTDRFEPVKTLELLQHYPVTTMCGAPTIFRMLVLQDLSGYRFATLRPFAGPGARCG